ncbi:MAG TPA: ZIP family metal transporter [Steroidobacter sp.]|uniref:ZIP family metal transporter n=1 Tax=Steroidobacter sp. TaxID=1978227 RepID=UPI002ED89419
MQAHEIFLQGLGASFLAGMGTVVGALWVFSFRRPSPKAQDALLSGAAGVMLAATFFSLLQPALDHAESHIASRPLAVLVVIGGLLGGAIGLYWIHKRVPHEHFVMGKQGPDSLRLQRLWLFIIAITLHNFPEGMAVGVGFASGDPAKAVPLAVGIGLQNVPEGLAVAAAMLAIDYPKAQAFLVASLTGLVEPLGGAVGSSAVWITGPMMPVVLGLAAGAMLFIISDEIIPETHRGGYEDLATFSLLGGFAVMMFLDAVFA